MGNMSTQFGSTSTAIPQHAPGNVADLLIIAAARQPKSGLFIAPANQQMHESEFISYVQLLSEARRIAGGLCRLIDPGNRVALLLDEPADFFPAFWSCMLAGYVPCPLARPPNDRRRWMQYLRDTFNLLDRPLFLCTHDRKSEIPAGAAYSDLSELRQAQPYLGISRATLSDVALVVLTSGSTGNSKAVALTHGNVLASMSAKQEVQQLTDSDVCLNWISFDHVAALLETHMLPLYAGAKQVHVSPSAVISDPLAFLRLIDRFRITMTFSPNFLFGQINAAVESMKGGESLDLSCLRHIISGGEANVVETCRRFLDRLVSFKLSDRAIWPAFGMTETCAGSIYSREFPAIDLAREFASVGVPVSGLEMRVVSPASDPLRDGLPGELQLRGPMIFSQYYNNREATASAFTADGWFRTGDLGKIEDGRLWLVGRHKDSIIVSGVNYFSQELEAALQRLDGIEPSFIAAFPTRAQDVDTEQLIVAFSPTFPLDDDETLHRLIVGIRNTTLMLWGFRPSLILPLPPSAFPKTTLGKIQRALMRQRLEAGDLDVHVHFVARVMERHLGDYVPPSTAVERRIIETLGNVLCIDGARLSTTASFFDLGGTSLELLKLARSLEQQFGVTATIATILQSPTARELAAVVTAAARPSHDRYNPIVPLHRSGEKPPLFCIHPGNGEILVYLNLANYFVDDRPVYALRPPGFNEGESGFHTFADMVNTYHRAICEVQPHGPYAIAGYSLGATIAFEVAKLIEAQGERLALLGCIDGFLWEENQPPETIEHLVPSLAYLLQLIDKNERDKLQAQWQTNNRDIDYCAWILKIASKERISQLNLDHRKFTTWARVAHYLVNLGLSHAVSGTVQSMTIFHSDGLDCTADEWLARLKGWDKHVRQPEYVRVPGDYFTLMSPAHVADFQAALRTQLRRAESL